MGMPLSTSACGFPPFDSSSFVLPLSFKRMFKNVFVAVVAVVCPSVHPSDWTGSGNHVLCVDVARWPHHFVV